MEDLESIRAAIAEIIEYQKHLADEITEIKTSIMDELINPVRDEFTKFQHDQALSDFRCKYGEKLEGFNDKLKVLEGNDFDVVEKAFDDFSSREDGMEPEEYIEKLSSKIEEQLDAIGAAFGVKPEKVEEVKVETTDGEEIKAEVDDGEVKEVETADETKEVEAPKTEASDEAEKGAEEEAATDVVEERPEDATDTPDDPEENRKYWEEQLKK